MPHVERRGGSIRVKWWAGEYALGSNGLPTKTKKYESASGPRDGERFQTEDEAYNFGLDRESDVRNDRHIRRGDGSMPMKDYCRTWPDSLDVGHLRERNIRSYLRLYIVPYWGEFAIGEIKPSAYRVWKKWLDAQPNIGAGYAREIRTTFGMIMDDAVGDGLRLSSPVPRKSRRGRFQRQRHEKKRPMDIADVFQLALNALVFWGFPGFVFVLTKAFTGMRPAELYALRREYSYPAWPASDPDAGQREESEERYGGKRSMPAIRVQYQHQRKDGVLGLFPPKYESYRTLVIPWFLAELLDMLMDSHRSEWVFLSIKDSLLANANFSYHYWRPIADGRESSEKRGPGHGPGGTWRPLPEIAGTAYRGKRLYLVRHGHKEWLDEDGHPRVAVEARMGHELRGVEGTYSNVTVPMERAIIESLQLRWERFVVTLGPDWRPSFPNSFPVDLDGWMKRQVKAAQAHSQETGS